MISMVERVARALCKSKGYAWSSETAATQEGWRKSARAAIAALREPTEGMRDAFRFCADSNEIWRAGIDAALAEDGE